MHYEEANSFDRGMDRRMLRVTWTNEGGGSFNENLKEKNLLDSNKSDDEKHGTEIRSCIGRAKYAFQNQNKILTSPKISLGTRKTALSIPLYGNEFWTIASHMRCLQIYAENSLD